jgi:hypothetical protein
MYRRYSVLQKNRCPEEVSFETEERGGKIEMKEKKKCPLFRSPESLILGTGYCDAHKISAMCEGEFMLCEGSSVSIRHIRKGMEKLNPILSGFKENYASKQDWMGMKKDNDIDELHTFK